MSHTLDILKYIYLSLGSLGLFFVVLSFSSKQEPVLRQGNLSVPVKEEKSHVDFSLLSSHPPFPFPDIDKTILPLSVNTRPDAPEHPDILIKVGDDQVVVPSHQLVYLHFQKGVFLSQVPTTLSLQNEMVGKNSIQMEVGIHMLATQKKSSFRFDDFIRDAKIAAAFPLKEGELLGEDTLFELYGGKAYQKKKGKMRLRWPDGSLLFIEKGDLLTFKEGRWHHGKDKNAPLAQILDMSSAEVQIRVWDVTGLESELVNISASRQLPQKPQVGALFTKLRRKTATKVTCRVGQKNVVLKKGDWLLRTKSGWRKIETAGELSDCLNYKLKGELFIFDGIEQHQFTGTLFNDMRTTNQKIRLPFGEGKQPT